MVHIFDTHGREDILEKVISNLMSMGARWPGNQTVRGAMDIVRGSRYIYYRPGYYERGTVGRITHSNDRPDQRIDWDEGSDWHVHICAWMRRIERDPVEQAVRASDPDPIEEWFNLTSAAQPSFFVENDTSATATRPTRYVRLRGA